MDTDPLVGQVLDGRYRVQSRIARGGMATVYVGHDTKLDRTVALKVMHANLASDEDFVRRFIGEAKHAAALSHPNVVAVYDQGTDRGHVFLAMEYVPGRNLRDLLNERGRLGPREALQVMQPILSALGAAHRAGLIHRDVKPENVLLTEDGQLKVADFGLARAESATKQTKTGMLIGTVGYVAPEQVISGNADARTDVYSAGIMLFELLTGRQPHQGETPLSVAYKHVNEVVPLPSSVIRGLPPRLDALVASATNHDPARRPADADHFLNAAGEVFRSLPHDIDAILASAAPMPVEHATTALPAPHLVPSAPPHDATQTLNPHTMVVSPAEQTAPQPGPSLLRTRRPLLYAGIAAGVVVVLLLGWLVWSQTLGNYETVPQLAGKSEEQARVAAEEVGLKVKRGPERYDEKAPKGTVADVRPKPGSDVKRGSILTLILSKGRPPVEIPQVAGLPVEEAKKRLQEKGLRVDETDEQASTTVPRGSVIKTEPAAGREQSPDEPVTLVVSIGIKLPDLKGLKRADAEAKVRRLGLNPAFQEQDAAPGQQPGIVIGQNPPPGTPLDKGAQVQIIVTKNNCAIPFLCPGDEDGDQAAVPNVVGQPIFMAKSTLEGAGFKVETHGKGLDRVGGQNPPAGAQAPKGSKVTVWGGGRNGG